MVEPDTLASEARPLRACGDREVIVEGDLVHDFASDSQSYYWLGVDGTDIVVFALPKAGGSVRTVTSFPGYFSFLSRATSSPVSGDSQFLMSDLVADDRDGYLYFSGDRQIWRVKKDGSEAVQPVSGESLNELGPAECSFAKSLLTGDALFACRRGRIFRMSRATGAPITIGYEAPASGRVSGFAVDAGHIYTNGDYDATRHLAPLLEITLDTGAQRELGEMTEALVPESIYLIGQDIVFNSLNLSNDAPDLETRSEWALRQGTYRLGLGDTVPMKISDSDIGLAFATGVDSSGVFTLVGDQQIIHITTGGTTRTLVDCTDTANTAEDIRFKDLYADEDGVYVRTEDGFYRYEK